MRDVLLRLRVVAMLLAALGLFLGFGATASAQVVDLNAVICATLDVNDDLTVSAEEAAALTVDLTGDLLVNQADFEFADAECDTILGGEGGVLTLGICLTLDVNDDLTVSAEEAAALTVDLTGDGVVDEADFALAEAECGPLLDDGGEAGDLQLVKFFCSNIEGNFFSVTAPFGAAAGTGDIVLDESGCEPGDASFLVVDAEGEEKEVATGDDGEISLTGLEAGVGTVEELSTGIVAEFTIEEDALTVVTFFNEVVTGGEGDDGDDDDGDDDGDDVDDPVVAVDAGTGGTVTTLPSTGQGNAGGNGGTIVLLLGALSLVTLAGGFAWRQRRTA